MPTHLSPWGNYVPEVGSTSGHLSSIEVAVGRARRDGGGQRLIARQGAGRYFIAYRAKVLLVAREQMRRATSMVDAAADRIAEDMDLVSQDRDKTYHDIADEDAVPTVTRMRTTPSPLPRVADKAAGTALQPFRIATPMVIRATREGSR